MFDILMERYGFMPMRSRTFGTAFVKAFHEGDARHVALFPRNQVHVPLETPVVAYFYDGAWEMLYEETFPTLKEFLEHKEIMRLSPARVSEAIPESPSSKPAVAKPGPRRKRPFEPVRFIEMLESNPNYT